MKQTKLTSLRHFFELISDVKIQGAMAIAQATLAALADYLVQAGAPYKQGAWHKYLSAAEKLSKIRPSEPMARNLARWYLASLRKSWTSSTQRRESNWFGQVQNTLSEFNYLIKEIENRVAGFGSRLVKQRQNIFTHCHSQLVENILILAKKQRRRFTVYHTETRPLFQGRLTAQHLRAAGIKSVMVVDGAAAWAVSNHSGDDIHIDWVLLGSDSLGKDGSALNKIGSFGIALAAYDSKIPVYVASSLLKLDVAGESKLELRPQQEIWFKAPAGIKLINYAFDRVPAKYIAGLITEFGIIDPVAAFKLARQKYPEIF
jgi:ribose 1,5-bisphosphate isomerase